MTKSVEKGIEFSAINEDGRPSHIWIREGQDDHVVWKIQDAPNVIDTHGSLANRGPDGNFIEDQKFIPNGYDDQIEYSAFEGIPTEQVKGYFRTADFLKDPSLAGKVAKGEEPAGLFVKNPDYNPKFDNLQHSGPRPELAGFPPYKSNPPGSPSTGEKFEAWDIEPWSKYYKPAIKDLQESLQQAVKTFADDSSKSIRKEVCGIASKRDGMLRKRGGGLCDGLTPTEPQPPAKEEPPGKGEPPEKGEPPAKEGPPTNGQPPTDDPERPPTAKEQEVALAAETASERDFTELMVAYKVAPVAQERWKMSLSDVRTKALGYKRLGPKAPALRPGALGKGITSKLGGGVFLGAVLWAPGVVLAFVANTTALDRLAAVTSIVPLVGCATQALAKAPDHIDTVDTALCFLGDALILGGATAPLGIAVHIVRAMVQAFKPPPELPTKEATRQTRDQTWLDFTRNSIYKYLYSDKYYYEKGDGFATKLESGLAIEAAAVLSHGAQTLGVLNATGARAIEEAKTGQEQTEIRRGLEASMQGIRDLIQANVSSRHRSYLVGLPALLRDNAYESLKVTADNYNNDLITEVTSFKNIQRYPAGATWDDIAGTISGAPVGSDPYRDARPRMDDIAAYLREQPIRIPARLDVAYVVGQSKALAGRVDPRVLSPQAYLAEQWPKWQQSSIDELCIRNALRVALFLEGKYDDARIKDFDAVNSNKVFDGLSLLTAIKFGRIYDEFKVAYAYEQYKLYLPESAIPWVTLPAVSPLPVTNRPSHPYIMGLVLGLTDSIVQAGVGRGDQRAQALVAKILATQQLFSPTSTIAKEQRTKFYRDKTNGYNNGQTTECIQGKLNRLPPKEVLANRGNLPLGHLGKECVEERFQAWLAKQAKQA
ncbi:Heat-labile enterotoxin, A chain [Hirsutella rhossiliensis]|uniref:Heat-labile enterotoxin, A chain n=1 Tax=Hirsutella rhossiliensis TaxID=111463 RepID=A0A9P8N5Y6_9HYPO|nr:Heat-labile enterotoxin, A chain [Hirsutella rhossiliensis]KAH0966389.1 Heat-labile enterotoxin, A chain [Hirsutella rhossiliensis]